MAIDRRKLASGPVKVAIVGGGCAAMAAAFELSRPQHRGKYQITLYQLGWRLGGKGASGRGVANRIEEHGLHLWMGFYENAFRLMRECYAELARDPYRCRIADWRDAFVAEPFIGVGAANGRPDWPAHFPPGDGLPGDPLSTYNPFSLSSYLIRTAVLLQTLIASVPPRSGATAVDEVPPPPGPDSDFASPAAVQAIVRRYLKFGFLTGMTGLISAARLLEIAFRRLASQGLGVLLPLLEALAENLKQQLAKALAQDPDLRPIWEIMDLLLAFQSGVVRFDLLNDARGFDSLNGYDTREWLRLNGASEQSVNSDLMRGLYDLAMAYDRGDPNRPAMAAGLGLRACLRMFFTYRGGMMWKMQAGMGDVVFAPFYQVLKQRGVRFKFFHRLRNVQLNSHADAGSAHIAGLDFDIQTDVRSGEYQPLIDIDGLPCWPALPDYDQLLDGTRFRAEGWNFESHWDRRHVDTRTLRVGEDFDMVVLAVGLGEIPYVCRELIATNRRWAAMVKRVKTIPTMAFQLWLRDDMKSLGWNELPTTMSGFNKPFDTWADMRHLIREESWPLRPKSLLYFCGAMPALRQPGDRNGKAFERRCREQVRAAAIAWTELELKRILPDSVNRSGKFRWDLLMDCRARERYGQTAGPSLLDSQFYTANINPSDHYVLSVPGSVEFRISPLDYTYDNMTIAGDWTDCGLNLGCVESAFISGRLAAHAISSSPALEDIVGYDHP